jgi:hypothetical protein
MSDTNGHLQRLWNCCYDLRTNMHFRSTSVPSAETISTPSRRGPDGT